MKFILRIGINIGACYLLMIFCAYLIGELVDELGIYPILPPFDISYFEYGFIVCK